jgi:hypothetical protein
MREPLAVAHIGFATRHHLHVLGVDEGELDAPFEEVIAAVSQSTSRSSSRVVVPNVRTSWRRRAPSPGERRHAVTLA